MTPPKKKAKKRKKKTQAQKDRASRAAWLEPLRKAERIVAVDPGATTGIATWCQSANGMLGRGSCDGDKIPIGLQCHFIAPGPETAIVLERSVFGPKMAAIKLAEYRGMALATASELEAGVVQVSPQTWQSVIFGPREGGRDTKALSVEHARKITGDETIADHNVADAICIAEWARREREKMV